MASPPGTAPPAADSSPPSPPTATPPPSPTKSPPSPSADQNNTVSSSPPPSSPSTGSPPSPANSSSPTPPAKSPPTPTPPAPSKTPSPPPASSPPASPPPSPPKSPSTPPGTVGDSTPPPTPPAPPTSGGGSSSPPPPSNNNNPAPTPPSGGDSVSPPSEGNSNNAPPVTYPPPYASSTPTPTPPSSEAALPPPSEGTISVSPPHPVHKQPPPHTAPANHTGQAPPSSSPPSPPPATLIGVGVGAAVVALVMVALCVACATKKKRKRPHRPTQYYGDPSRGGPQGGGEYYSGQQNWHNGNHVMKVPPGPGMGVQGGGNWGAQPAAGSGETTGNFSGGPLPPASPMALGFNQSTFSYDELAAATNGFSQANLLGQGGFGYVHKGVLPNGKELAVKSLKSGSGQGEREFQAEVEIISRVHHRHLVSLVGYCIAEGRRMLVYEFVPNQTLEYHLYGQGRPTMDWPTRLRIALGSAKGLAYLHEDCHPRIIHRDIKAANILLDSNYEAMVADFGLAKLSSDNYTHVSTRVMGTFGYMAPEYASSGKLTDKSDVFSYGVMLLELVTGRKPIDTTNSYMEDSLVDWARPLLSRALEDGNFQELVDPRLEGNYTPHELASLAACAAAAVRHSAKRRPKMSQILRALEGDASLEDLSGAVKPGQSSVYSSQGKGSSEYNTEVYNADLKRFREVVLSSLDDGTSSEYGTSGEYGGHTSTGESSEMGKLDARP